MAGNVTIGRRAVLSGAAAILASATAPTASAQGAAGFPARPITLICPGPPAGRPMLSCAPWRKWPAGTSASRSSSTTRPAPRARSARLRWPQPPNPMATRIVANADHDRPPAADAEGRLRYRQGLHLYHPSHGLCVRCHCQGRQPLQELDRCRRRFAKANPGKLNYASTGAGTSLHIGMEQIAAHSGIKITHVPFKGEAEAFAALLGGHVDVMAAGTGRDDMIESGQIRILNIWSESARNVSLTCPL